MISFNQVSISFAERKLLNGVSCSIEAKQKAVISGPSGSGKSSLLKAVAGAIPLTAGSISIDGLQQTPANMAKIRTLIAFIGQEPIMGASNVKEALLLPFTYKAHQNARPSDEQIIKLIERLHLNTDILQQETTRISGGEKQRIAITRALLLNKTIFLADEITSALDPESKKAVIEELFKPDYTLLSVSHDPDWINACTTKLTVQNGDLIKSDAKEATA